MRSLLLGLFICLALGRPAAAAPVIEKTLPEKARAGSTIFVRGSGFGDKREDVKVWFGEAAGKVVTAQDGSLAVTVPWDAPAQGPLIVEVKGVRSNSLAFACLASVRLEIGKNPLDVGATTTATFTVYHTDKPVTISFRNENPDVVTFEGGNEQKLTTSGGSPNKASFTVRGIGGPRLYQVAYEWVTGIAVVDWTLQWGRVNLAQKSAPTTTPGESAQPPPATWSLPWDRVDWSTKNRR